MNFTKCAISKNKNFYLVKICNNFDHKLNTIPLSNEYMNLYFHKKFYIFPNPVSSFYSKKNGHYLGKFKVIYSNDFPYFKNKNIITLPLNTRFFLLYYYAKNISYNDNLNYEVDNIFNSISYMDNNYVFDNEKDVIMYPLI